jgi:hypothetical protein
MFVIIYKNRLSSFGVTISPKIMILSSRSSKYWLLNIWTLQINLTMKFHWKRKSSDYTLRLQATIHYISIIWLPTLATSTYSTLQCLYHYLWPKLSRHWYNLQKSVFACQKYIWKAFKKRIFQYHNIFQ